MQRRTFIQSLFGLGLLPFAVQVDSAKSRTRVLVQASPVAGFQYHDGEDVWPQLTIGGELNLIREAGNRHDRQAVRVDWHGYKLGYVPRWDNAAVSQMLDRGQRLKARITRLNNEASPWGWLFMEVMAD